MKFPHLNELDRDLFTPDYDHNISNRFSQEFSRFWELQQSTIGKKNLDYSETDTLIFLILDGLGQELYYAKNFKKSFETSGEWISSTYPTITPTALSSIFTGLPPSRHGITGHLLPTFNTKSFHQISLDKNMNWLDYDFTNSTGAFLESGNLSRFNEPDVFILGPANPLHPSHGIIPMLAGKRIRSYLTLSHLRQQLRLIIGKTQTRKVIIVYSMMYDIYSHLIGKKTVLAQDEISKWGSMLSHFLDQLSPNNRSRTKIIISADHGHKLIDKEIKMKVRAKERIEECMTGIGKSGRVLHFYPKYGQADYIRKVLEKAWGSFGVILDMAENSSLIGPNPQPPSLQRIGSVNFIPYGGITPLWEAKYNWFNNLITFPRKFLSTTEHGSLTKDELLTPFFLFSGQL